ncbi:unnamed protein product [Diamesa serratosioi]
MSKMSYWKIMTRRKPMPVEEECDESKLVRVFGTFDLTALGVGATLGVGVYVLAGHVAKDQAGPSVILSFLIAAATSFLAGLCYAEFASRVPKSGSAYIFTYCTIGEFAAFIIGWNLLLEYIIGSASISRGLSLYIDSLSNNTMKTAFRELAPISWDFLSPYFDLFAFTVPLILGMALAFGLKKSAGINNIFCMLNLGIVIYVIIAGSFRADIKNWQIDPKDFPEYNSTIGEGGFFPFGFSGTLKGAATCFFGFVGFDCIATTGEEVRKPIKSVPRAILFSLIIIFLAYFGVSMVLTLMWPYYLQNAEAPLPHVFHEIGWVASEWIVTIGGIIGLIASLFGAMFPLPRILYAMAQDGLIFRELGRISDRFKTPVTGTLCAALLTGCFSALFDLAALVNMLSIGVLLAYTVVAISIIVLRFSESQESSFVINERVVETSNLLRRGENITTKNFFRQLVRLNSIRNPSQISMTVVGTMIVSYCICSLGLAVTILHAWDNLANGETWAQALAIFFGGMLLIFCILISVQPKERFQSFSRTFKVPFVPFIPAISIFINIYLMLLLDYYTWIRFGVWMIIGLVMYFACACLYKSRRQIVTKTPRNSVNNPDNDGIACELNKSEATGSCETISSVIDEVSKVNESKDNGILNVEITHEISEENKAIEMLDTVLEQEDKEDELRQKSLNYKRKSFDNSAEFITVEIEVENKIEPKESKEELELETLRQDIILEIELILDEAIIAIEKLETDSSEINSLESDKSENESEDCNNVFRNKSFLNRLSSLIGNVNPSPKKVITFTTDENVHETRLVIKKQLNYSKSVPNLQCLDSIESKNSLYHDDTIVDYNYVQEKESEVNIPPAPVFVEELFERVATMKLKKKSLQIPKVQVDLIDEPKDPSDSETETLDKTAIKLKLEQIFKAPPVLRIKINKPVPLPRTSLNNDNESSPKDKTVKTPSSAMDKHKLIFNEVLKKIKKD